MDKVKVLNLYAGIGGNRTLWCRNVEVTAVENVSYIAEAYKEMFPEDTVIETDAHQYLLDHFQEFDFIWSSPPCPTHSRTSTSLSGWGIHRYPDMSLYQEIIFLKHFYKGNWVVENVVPYYDSLINPTAAFDRHYFWSNFHIDTIKIARDMDVSRATSKELADFHMIALPASVKDKRKLLRNAVNPALGKHVFDSRPEQTEMFAHGPVFPKEQQ
jgi:DNA (cytosine-5)-methyltransferase 1